MGFWDWNKLGIVLAGGVLLLGAAATQAEEPGHARGARESAHGPAREARGGQRFEFREHDVRRFGAGDRDRWIGGRWNNTCFAGRCGWWWLAGGQWYFYERPVYPYPLAVSTIGFMEPVPVTPAPVVVMPAPPPAAPPPALVPPPPKFLYYCDDPAGYYPAVASCNTAFRQVAVPPLN